MRILVNAANLHLGGGMNVAASIIDEISRMDMSKDCAVLASTGVTANLAAMNTDLGAFSSFNEIDLVRFRGAWKRLPIQVSDVDLVLNVFGPVYSPRLAWRSVMGFAQPWIAFPDNPASQRLSPLSRVKRRAKYAAMAPWFLLADTLVVEQESIKVALQHRRMFRGKRIVVVSNTVDSIFTDPTRWTEVEMPTRDKVLNFGVISRNYLHKNLAILADVRRALRDRHGVDCDMFVTLKPQEWADLPQSMQQELVNVGQLTIDQCPSFYRHLDAVVFPTLLECFSATPLEARVLGVPLFASDIPTVRETVDSYAEFFNPLDADEIADKLFDAFGDEPRRQETIERAITDAEASASSAHGATVDGSKRRAEALVAECRRVLRQRYLPSEGEDSVDLPYHLKGRSAS